MAQPRVNHNHVPWGMAPFGIFVLVISLAVVCLRLTHASSVVARGQGRLLVANAICLRAVEEAKEALVLVLSCELTIQRISTLSPAEFPWQSIFLNLVADSRSR